MVRVRVKTLCFCMFVNCPGNDHPEKEMYINHQTNAYSSSRNAATTVQSMYGPLSTRKMYNTP